MKIVSFLLLLVFFFFLPQTSCDIRSDKQALLNFADLVPHSLKLNWNSSTPLCTSWLGISCDRSRSHVLSVRLPAVGLYGPIPANSLGKLNSLITLSLRSNRLTGDLPSDLLCLPSLQYVYLQHNNFSGTIPSTLSQHLISLDLSFNSFTGNIPTNLQTLTNLTTLSLQNNSLTGSIPQIYTSQLKQLNLSYNNFNGSVPSSLQNFPSSSFEGNDMLCGTPLNQCSIFIPSPSPSPSPSTSSPSPRSQPPSPTNARKTTNSSKKKKLSTKTIIAIAIGASLVPLLLFATILVCRNSKKKDSRDNRALKEQGGRDEKPSEDFGSGVQDAEKNKLVFFEGSSNNFDLEDLLRASAEVLGKGTYGTTYKAILEEGSVVAVKRLKDVVAGKRDFEQQMEGVGRITHHPNVLPLCAYYYSKDEKLLVYNYVTGGSFFRLLHGSNNFGRTPVDWDTRVKISLETARGIAHIHSSGGGKSIHGNIKSSNILITQDLRSCISDFGLTPIMSYPAVPARSAGYRAPEVIETKKYTKKSDIYSFGVLLLEMLTGKAPVQLTGQDDAVDLPRWVQSVVREEWTAEVFDVELLRYNDIEEEMVLMLQIAMACVGRVPEVRPTMDEVVRMIEQIRPANTSSEENKRPNNQNP
ncbi:probable inactive receptor kinase At3g08680 [Euphorbia lathyris]|uniref:probable inactive receptor kinase At3g08680 n=1 Tax=Euphorbia lathyris TaxID=212925 RepID=UPI0033137613